MYLVVMDQLARQDIAAASAAHHELGREYDGAVAEGLVERIGAEIDKRVDARLRGGDPIPAPSAPAPPVQPAPRTEIAPVVRPASWPSVILALGSMGIGAAASAAVVGAATNSSVTPDGATQVSGLTGGSVAIIVVIWLIIGIVNVAYARRR